jgi:23S rRNA pseudouridine1911/1915/1917 synthase
MNNADWDEEDDAGEGDARAFSVAPGEGDVRLDKFLAIMCPDLSRTRLQALIDEGMVMLDGKPSRTASFKIREGAEVSVVIPPPVDDTPRAENIPLDIIYEDDDLLVINKQAGLVVHPAAGHAHGTLVNALLHHCGDSLSGIGGVRRPGIVHRLDKETSGLMLVAKNDAAHRGLSAQLADRSLSRTYSAFVWDAPNIRTGLVDQPIGRHPTNRLKMAVTKSPGSREARTHFSVIETFGANNAAHVQCDLETGRTHQVRVHMAYINHPLIGDPLYGIQPTGRDSRLRKGRWDDAQSAIIRAFPRQALHAVEIRFIHPATGAEESFECPLPPDMAELLNALKSVG